MEHSWPEISLVLITGPDENRAYRNGQFRMVVVKTPRVEGTIDEQLWQLLNAKRRVAQDLIEPEQVDEDRVTGRRPNWIKKPCPSAEFFAEAW